MAPRVKDSDFHAAVTKQIVLDTLPYIAALQPPRLKPPAGEAPAPRIAATANMARAAKLEAPLMPRGLRTDLTALAKAALAGLGIPFALVVLRSLVF
ncbi:MAG: hypothetical protein ACYTGX_05690 [Planctomycetota bacterium]|jgi:hypothetical protein